MAEKNNLQQKIKVMGKLFDAGIVSEKSLQDMSTEQMLQISGITIPDMGMILEIRRKVKTNHLYSYLAEGKKDFAQGKTDREEVHEMMDTDKQEWEGDTDEHGL